MNSTSDRISHLIRVLVKKLVTVGFSVRMIDFCGCIRLSFEMYIFERFNEDRSEWG
jgi:hypothetical protein